MMEGIILPVIVGAICGYVAAIINKRKKKQLLPEYICERKQEKTAYPKRKDIKLFQNRKWNPLNRDILYWYRQKTWKNAIEDIKNTFMGNLELIFE